MQSGWSSSVLNRSLSGSSPDTFARMNRNAKWLARSAFQADLTGFEFPPVRQFVRYNQYMPRYTDEQIAGAVSNSLHIYGVLRHLGIRLTGGSHAHMTRRIARSGIDTSHFVGSGHNGGKTFPAKRRDAQSILVLRSSTERRQHAKYLRRALLAIGRPYECEGCGNSGTWQGKPITLQVDHRDRNWTDDRAENLRFVCPNCHATL